MYEQQGRFDLAIPELKKTSVRLAPDSALAVARLGQGFAVAGHIDEEAQEDNRAVEGAFRP